LEKPVKAEITVPGSKSITNRALVLAALADGEITLRGALWSEDTQVMVDGLLKLGFVVKVEPDPAETCNRAITVQGLSGKIPGAGTREKPLELFVGNAGTAARFLATLVSLGHGIYRLDGVKRMRERPQEALFDALRELGYCIDSANSKLPALVHGSGSKPGAICCVSIAESSQFASALLMCAKAGGWRVNVVGENAEESPYVAMTSKLIEAFPNRGGEFQIEPDASSGSYFWAAEHFVEQPEYLEYSEQFGIDVRTKRLNTVTVAHWPQSGWQVDEEFPRALLMNSVLYLGLELGRSGDRSEEFKENVSKRLKNAEISRRNNLGDSIMTAIVLAPFALGAVRFTDLGRLRVQECERVVALRTELTKCGAKVVEEGDTLTVYPSKLHGAEIETYNDHRMAMCFAILGLKVPGIKLKNPACVKKTFPNFFQKLADAPPRGLGATILDAKTGRTLTRDELFAE
jgi:3-phosphoshikimate 1-carboxyvinyltransferase